MRNSILFGLLILCFTASNVLAAEFETDGAFLDEIQRRALEYFVVERNLETGLVRDWAWNVPGQSSAPASIAATGFALTAYGVGVERGWLNREEAKQLVKRSLYFLRDQAAQEHGFFYHFFMFEKGLRAKGGSELSPIDTALAAAGILFVSEYFSDDGEIKALARDIWERIDWPWMLNGGSAFAMAWSPEQGFFKNRWAQFDESLLMYFLALASPSHPVPAESWQAFRRPMGSYADYHVIFSPPLFTHQYPHIWIDFRNKHDKFADYFENSRRVSLIHRQFAIDQSVKYKSYGPDSWGLTAAEGPAGYKAYGAPPGWANHDGTIAPTGCGSSIAFTPKESMACLRHFYENHKPLWGRYGFSDSFNLNQNFYSKKVFAINQGPLILMIENHRSGLIWKMMNRIPEIQNAFQKAGFQEGTKELNWRKPPMAEAPSVKKSILMDGEFDEWENIPFTVRLDASYLESGTINRQTPPDAHISVKFAWNEEFLYFYVEAEDDSFVFRRNAGEIWRDDMLELFIDPEGDGLNWGSPSDIQLGFRPEPESSHVKIWSWFKHPGDPSAGRNVFARSKIEKSRFLMEGRISWDFLGIQPAAGKTIRITPAFHDLDRDRSEGKLIWFFRNEKKLNCYELGHLKLNPPAASNDPSK